MPRFLTRAFVLLVLCFYGMASGLVSKEFAECSEFFYKRTQPQGIIGEKYQPICQRYKNKYYFATLYDRELHAALYSAYKFSTTVNEASRPKDQVWFYEPQLEDNKNSNKENMEPIKSNETTFQSQASLLDYKDSSIYTKGHLAPSMNQGTADGKIATFTLTNVLPQFKNSNSGPWAEWEKEIVKHKKSCTVDMYVITGGIPFEDVMQMNEKVSIPEYMWSAYCCTAYGKKAPPNIFPTGAAVGRNAPTSGTDIVKKGHKNKGFDVWHITLQELTKILNKRLNMAITLFQGDCKKL